MIGAGGVGLNVIRAKIAGAGEIIAIDMFESKLEMAKAFGATKVIKGRRGATGRRVVATNERGADVSFESSAASARPWSRPVNMVTWAVRPSSWASPMDVFLNLPPPSPGSTARRR